MGHGETVVMPMINHTASPINHGTPMISHGAPMINHSNRPMLNHSAGVIHNASPVITHGAIPSNGIIHGSHPQPAPVYSVPHNGGTIIPHAPSHPAPPSGNFMPGPLNGGHPISSGAAAVIIRAAADVKIKVNGELTKRNKEEELFKTPALKAGKTYAYEVTAEAVREGQTVTAKKRIYVRAGEQSAVDFGNMEEATLLAKMETTRITVLMPKGSELYVENQKVGEKEQETFDTPRLSKGKVYSYTLKMRPKNDPNDVQTRKVAIEPGKDITVDFRLVEVAAR